MQSTNAQDRANAGAYPDALDAEGYISPCPFSPRYQITRTQAWNSLALFVLYRAGLGAFLTIPMWIGRPNALWSIHDEGLFRVVATLYLLSALAGVPFVLKRATNFGAQVQLQVISDIGLISLMMKASGGVASGLGILLACSVAAGGILAGGRCALGFAAAATLAVLVQEILLAFGELPSAASSTSAGLLGAAFFAIALLAIALSRRAEQSQMLAARHRHDLASLRSLNSFIVENLQSGIIVMDEHHGIRMANPAAQRLLDLQRPLETLDQAGSAFLRAYLDWVDQGREASGYLTSSNGYPVQVRFARLSESEGTLSMAILEDSALHQRRVQQSKLKSLGQLTASIAHEIRNPLSAIHQAAQLLRESTKLGAEDCNLIEILLKNTQRVNQIIENITLISQRRAPQRECIVLVPWLKRFLADFAEEQRLDPCPFRLSSANRDLEALVDPSQLKQILENLCSNALKYGKTSHAAPEIVVGRDESDGRPSIDVLDYGDPIDGAVAEQIFEPFFTTSRSGTGLGLYIARELAELNQARLEYRPADGGSRFRISLTDANQGALEL